MSTTTQLLTHTDAARFLGISERELRRLRDTGAVPIVRLNAGRKGRRYSVAALQKWIEGQSKPTTIKKGERRG
jgi:hypothetical protein